MKKPLPEMQCLAGRQKEEEEVNTYIISSNHIHADVYLQCISFYLLIK